MKFLLLLLATLGLFQPVENPTNNTVDDLARQAEIAYTRGDFQRAITLYQQVINAGVQTSEVYFNLGNANYELHKLGLALVSYRRAERIAPRDEDLRVNMARVRTQRVDTPNNYLNVGDQIADWVGSWGTNSEIETCLLIVWWVFCGGLAGYILLPYWRKWIRWVLVNGCFILVFVGGMEGIRLVIENTHPSAVIISEVASVMTGPDITYMEIFTIHSAGEVRVIEQQNGWVRIQLPDLQEGWIKAESLQIV